MPDEAPQAAGTPRWVKVFGLVVLVVVVLLIVVLVFGGGGGHGPGRHASVGQTPGAGGTGQARA